MILEKMEDVKRQQKKITKNGKNKIKTRRQILIDVVIKE